MNRFSDYAVAALSTAIYPGRGRPLGLIYTALKGAGEAGEFSDAVLCRDGVDALRKEVGDELWYCAAKADELGTSLTELLGTDNIDDVRRDETRCLVDLGLSGAALAGGFAEQLGKAIRDDSYCTLQPVADGLDFPPLTPARRTALLRLLTQHVINLTTKAQALETSLGAIAAENIAKLADRRSRGVLGGSGDTR